MKAEQRRATYAEHPHRPAHLAHLLMELIDVGRQLSDVCERPLKLRRE